MAWDYFCDGVVIGGVRVLERLNGAQLQTEVLYRVRYACCAAEAEVTHRYLMQREQKARQLCQTCARKAQYVPGGENTKRGAGRRRKALGATVPLGLGRLRRDYPPGGSGYANGLFYRFARGRVFRWNGFEWVLSTRPKSDIRWEEPELQSA